jgi:hypothetical protein
MVMFSFLGTSRDGSKLSKWLIRKQRKGVEWSQVNMDKAQSKASLNTTMDLLVQQKAGNSGLNMPL